ncbi:MAG: hypothetical protein OHK0029_37700 [Armatimonadaceae bacterium]
MSSTREPCDNSPEDQREAAQQDLENTSEREEYHPWRSPNPLDSFRHATTGVVDAVKTQRNMRVHLMLFAPVLAASFYLEFSPLEMVALLVTATLVLFAEMVNTAVETVVDMVTLEYHPNARLAKDVAAGGVLLAAINSVAVGAFLFLQEGRLLRLLSLLQSPLGKEVLLPGAGLFLVVLLAAKWKYARKRVVSPYTALTVYAATLIVLVSHSLFSSALAVTVAGIVSLWRVQRRHETVQEVLLGAALGLLLAASMNRLSHRVGEPRPWRLSEQTTRATLLSEHFSVNRVASAGGIASAPSLRRTILIGTLQ